MSHKPKQVHKTKEQLIYEQEQKKHQAVMGTFIDERFMPVLEGSSNTIEEATQMCDMLKIRISGEFQQFSKKMKLAELPRDGQLKMREESADYQKFQSLLDVLGEQSIEDAVAILQGVVDETNRLAWLQVKDKKLSDFKNNG